MRQSERGGYEPAGRTDWRHEVRLAHSFAEVLGGLAIQNRRAGITIVSSPLVLVQGIAIDNTLPQSDGRFGDGIDVFSSQIVGVLDTYLGAGHIHQAPISVAGPIVVPLFVAPAPPTSARHIKQSGMATPNAGTTGAALCQNPGAYYVNYHTIAFPGGAIRGQLH